MLSLAALASWESVILASIAGADGTIEARDAQITRSGMYAEYPAIFATYLELSWQANDEPTALEALKRAIFLAWYGFTTPSVFTGISELPETLVRDVMGRLDSAIADGRADDELRLMLAWYHAQFGYPFEHFGPVRQLEPFVADVDVTDIGALSADPSKWHGRGQMGLYWARKLEQGVA